MTVQVPTSPNICFCTTWGKQNKRNITFLFKITHTIHILSRVLSVRLTVYPIVQFSNWGQGCWGHRSEEIKLVDVFVLSFNAYFACCFSQVVQKQTLGEVGTWTIIRRPAVSGIFVPKTIKILHSFFKLQQIMSGILFLRRSVLELWK